MSELLLRLLGVWSGRAEKIVRVLPELHTSLPAWVVFFVAVGLCIGVYWIYARTPGDFSRWRRWTMATLRALVLILVFIMLLRPMLAVTVSGSVRQSLLILVDGSSSMQIKDHRESADDATRVAIGLDRAEAAGGLKQAISPLPPDLRTPVRIEQVKNVFKSQKLDLLKRLSKDYDLSIFQFDRDVQEVAMAEVITQSQQGTSTRKAGAAESTGWVDRLRASGKVTSLGDSVRDTILRKRGVPMAGIWVISDFASNSGSLPLEAAKMAADENVPLYTWGVGTTAPKDIIVGSVLAPETAFAKDEVPVTVRVRSQRFSGKQVKLQLLQNGKEVGSAPVDLQDDGEQDVHLTFTPQEVGEFNLTAWIKPEADETVIDNNLSQPKHIRVVDGRIKVLHIEQAPRWEFKYVQSLLMRDRRVEYKCILLEGDASITEAPDSPYVKDFPTLKDLGQKYDLVILGDVDPKRLPESFVADVNQFVSRLGGSMIMVAGRRYTPNAYKKTPLEKMLPVDFEGMSSDGETLVLADRPIKLELTPQGKSSLMMKLLPREADSLALWTAFPAIYWDARVLWAKSGAEVYVVDSDPGKASRFGKMPVIALQQYGLGQVMYIGTDNTWRWRKNGNDAAFTTLWSQIIDRLAMPHMLGSSKRTQLSADREKYAAGDRVTVYARLYRADTFEPVTDVTVKGFYRSAASGTTVPAAVGGREQEVTLRAIPDQRGMYRCDFVVPVAGVYSFGIADDLTTKLDFVVYEPNLETGETSLNLPLMREMASKSGGQWLREEDLYKLPELIKNTSQPVLSRSDIDLWCSPLYYIVLVVLLGWEWVLRKMSQLK